MLLRAGFLLDSVVDIGNTCLQHYLEFFIFCLNVSDGSVWLELWIYIYTFSVFLFFFKYDFVTKLNTWGMRHWYIQYFISQRERLEGEN